MALRLDESDFLTFHLYIASKSPRVKKARLKSWITMAVVLLVITFFLYDKERPVPYDLLVIVGIFILVYPLYIQWRYKNHYIKLVRETYKNRFGEISDLTFTHDTIETKTTAEEMKFAKSEVEEVHEIRDHYFLKFRSGLALIISKKKTDNIEEVRNEIRLLVETMGIKHHVEMNWK